MKQARFSRAYVAVFAFIFVAVGGYVIYNSSRAAVTVCDLSATPANFDSQVSAATAGQTICLGTGNYGTWSGTNKAITITKQPGATATMEFEFRPEDMGFTLDGLTLTGGAFLNYGDGNGPKNITIKNSAFTGSLTIDGPLDSNILLDSNTHININFAGPTSGVTCSGTPAAIHFPYNNAVKTSGVTVRNSLFRGGNKDGIQTGIGVNISNNEFDDIGEHGARCADYNDAPHTDNIQLLGAKGSVVRGNYIHRAVSGIVAYDGIEAVTIEDNIVETIDRMDGIELLSDKNSIVRHNVVVYKTGCGNGTNVCGGIWLGHKPADPAGTGTVIENNIASYISLNDGSTASTNKNMLRTDASGTNFIGVPSYVGGATPTSYAGFALVAGSPGKSAGSDGLDVGIRVTGSPSVTPTPTPTSSANPADLNNDGKVNVFDLSIVLSHWGQAGSGDIDNNGTVNVFDLSRLLGAWTG